MSPIAQGHCQLSKTPPNEMSGLKKLGRFIAYHKWSDDIDDVIAYVVAVSLCGL